MINNLENNKLAGFTKILLGLCLALSLLSFTRFDLTEVLPINLDRILQNANTALITLFIFGMLFIITMIKATVKIIVITWSSLLIVNTINILKTTYSFITWNREPTIKTATISDAILSHQIEEYTWLRYFVNVFYPWLWIILSVIVIRKFTKACVRCLVMHNKQIFTG